MEGNETDFSFNQPTLFHRQVDIWSVGCTVYEMFTGKPPWHEMHDQVSAMFKIVNSATPPPFPESVSDDAKEFLLVCFQR